MCINLEILKGGAKFRPIATGRVFEMYCIMLSTIAIPIRESVDSLCRDGADMPIA